MNVVSVRKRLAAGVAVFALALGTSLVLPGLTNHVDTAKAEEPYPVTTDDLATTTTTGTCSAQQLATVTALSNPPQSDNGDDKSLSTVEARIKPGTTDTLQILLKGISHKTAKYFAFPPPLEKPSKWVVFLATDEQANSSNMQAKNVTLQMGADALANGGHFQQFTDENFKNIFAGVRPWGDSRDPVNLDGDKETVAHNPDNRSNLNKNEAKTKADYYVPGEPWRMVNWYRQWGDYGYAFALYFEAKVKNPDDSYNIDIPFTQKGTGWGGRSVDGSWVRINWQPPESKPLTVHGYYDSPVLNHDLYGVPAGEELPKGLQVVGYFEDASGNIIKNIGWQNGNQCTRATNGYIDFSNNNMKELWKNLGQNAGRQFFLPPGVSSEQKISFKFMVYSDSGTMDKNHKLNYSYDGSSAKRDRMRVGYLPVRRSDGTITPAKMMYYLQDSKYDVDKHNYTVRLRPFVLKDADPKFPLNPVATNPYRHIIQWLDFGEPTSGGNDPVTEQIVTGKTITKEVIPGFLSVSCHVDEVKYDVATPNGYRYLDSWAPGYYYQDGGPWMIGDNQFVGIHQTDTRNTTTIKLSCHGEQKNPNASDPDAVTEVPVKGFVLLDAESTDKWDENDQTESLSIKLEGGSKPTKYYPINGYSSCNKTNRDALTKLGVSVPSSLDNVIGAVSYNATDDLLEFKNPNGRCGENSDEYGANMGPALMAVAPIPVGSAATQTATLKMVGKGKQGLAFGVVLAGDTSNADYNNAMPPVYQFNALSFHGGEAGAGEGVDWTQPTNYQKNYYYYGSRLGADSAPLGATGNGFKIRDGHSNDGIANIQTFELKRGNDGSPRLQPRILPLNTSMLNTGADGKYLASQKAKTMTVAGDGATLAPVTRTTKPLEVKVSCGEAIGSQTWVRGWADFNGNGVFDPDEASDLVPCPAASAVDAAASAGQMPHTPTQVVTLKFAYPSEHDLSGVRDVWMRIRAVNDSDKAVLENNNRAAAHGNSASPVVINHDKDVPQETQSAAGSWEFSRSGETEDYTFSITPPVVAQPDGFCLAKNDSSVTIDVLKNDIDETNPATGKPWREPNPDTLVFVKGQDGVKVTDSGKIATTAEGVYKVENGKIVFTPATSGEFHDKLQALKAGSQAIPMKGVEYAFNTKDGNTFYDRVMAGSSDISGTAEFACEPQVRATYWANQAGSYQWDLNKEVLKGNQGSDWVSSGDDRNMSSAKDGDKVPLTYRLKVTAKRNNQTTSAIKGYVTLLNPKNADVTTADTNGVQLTVEGASNIACSFDDPASVNKLVIPKDQAETLKRSFTCVTTDGAALPANPTFKVKPTLNLAGGGTTSPIDATGPDQSLATSESGDSSVKLTDSLGVATTGGDAVGTATDLGEVNVTDSASQTKALKDVVLSANNIIPNGSAEGTTTLQMVIPADKQPLVPTEAQNKLVYTNTASLCEANAAGCVAVPKIPDPSNPSDPPKVPERKAVTTVTRSNPSAAVIYVVKTGGSEDTPLGGADFKLFNGNDTDTVGSEISGAVSPVTTDPATNSKFKLTGLQVGQTYWLKETKAPLGHQVLAQPIKFKVTAADGTVQILAGASTNIKYEKANNEPTIFVHDVETGSLPASGGRGVLLSLAFGLVLLISGLAVVGRPQRQRR